MSTNLGLDTMYQRRFGPDLAFRQQMWRVLCADFFQQFVPPDATVMEVGAGYCEFINHIRAGHKIAIDLNPDTREHAATDVQVVLSSSTDLSAIPNRSVDVAFASNFFEHLERAAIVETIGEVKRALRPGGRFMILQPNYRYCYKDYWMFFDHVTALDHRSLSEVRETSGFRVIQSLPRFLPYTTKSRMPKSATLVRAYLRVPLAWRLLGKQAFVVAEATS